MLQFSECHSEEHNIYMSDIIRDFVRKSGEDLRELSEDEDVLAETFGKYYSSCHYWTSSRYFTIGDEYLVACESGKKFKIFAKYFDSVKRIEQVYQFFAEEIFV
jgi:hypothetical protein